MVSPSLDIFFFASAKANFVGCKHLENHMMYVTYNDPIFCHKIYLITPGIFYKFHYRKCIKGYFQLTAWKIKHKLREKRNPLVLIEEFPEQIKHVSNIEKLQRNRPKRIMTK